MDAKRKPWRESGIEAWYPYYAGYTEAFATMVIEAAGLDAGSTVLDPWNGCGTSTRVADSLGHHAIGIDINPVVALVASAKLARANDAIHVSGLANRIANASLKETQETSADDQLRHWLCPKLTRLYRTIEAQILSDLAVRDGQILNPAKDSLPPLAAFLLLALQRSARRFAGIETSSNPTWLRPKRRPPSHPPEALASTWIDAVKSMALDLHSAATENLTTASEIHLGDSRELPISSHSVDLVVTSPPYCTRIDYVVSTSFELATMGTGRGDGPFDDLRRCCMGTPLARPGRPAATEELPEQVAGVLKAIREHPSKSSRSYYYKTYAQYFSDSLTSLKELRRVLKPGGVAALVVQSSYYKEIYVDLPKLYQELATSLAFRATIAAESNVTRFLAQINSRSSTYRRSTSHREAVVVLEAA